MAIYLNWVSDAGLVQKTLAGNREAFGVLVERHLPMAHALAWSHTGGGADADDIVQDAFLRAFVKLDALREAEKFAGWLAGIVRNLAADARLRQARIDRTPVDQLADAPAPASRIEEEEIYALLRVAVATLEEPSREVLTLHYFARKSLREVAEIQGITREAAMKRLQRAREALGKQLLDKLDGAPMSRRRMDARKKAVLALIASAPMAWKAAAATGISGAAVAAVVALLALLGAGGFAGYKAIEAQRGAVDASLQAALAGATAAQGAEADPAPRPVLSEAAEAPAEGTAETASGNCRIRGKVMDINGAPVAGALVKMELVTWDAGKLPPKNTRRYEVSSGDDGKFEVTSLTFGEYSILSFSGNTADVIRTSLSENYTQRDEELYLKPCLPLGGRVVNAAGEPVPGAIVLPHTYVPMGAIDTESVTSAVRVTTDDEGKFRFGLLWYGGWRIQARAEGHAASLSQEVEAGNQNVVITMLDAASVSGHVRFANTSVPAEGVEVRLRSLENAADSFSGKTASDGSFTIGDMAPGAYRVETDGGVGGIQDGPREIVVEAGKSQALELVLGGGGTISGRVYDAATGEGIPGYKMYLYASSGGSFGRDMQTDALGGYFYTGLPEGAYQYSIDSDLGYFPQDVNFSRPVTLKGGQEIEVNFPLKKGVPVSGVVVDSTGEPVAKASVRLSMPLSAWGGSDYGHATSKADGSFVVWAREAGLGGTLTAEKERLGATPKKLPRIPAEGMKDVRIALNLVGDATVEARMSVKGIEQKLAAQLIEANLFPQGGDGVSTKSIRVLPSGEIRFKDVTPGSYKIMVSSRSSGVSLCESETFSVPPGKVVSGIDLICATQGDLSITGRVLDATGAPIAGAKVSVSDYRTELTPFTTKQDGNFVLEGLNEGKFQIAATAEGFSPANEGAEAGGDPVDIILQPARILRGRVVDADTGAPIRSFRVGYIPGNLTEDDPRRHANVMALAASGKQFTSEDGLFELKDVLDVEGMVVVGSEGYAHESQAVPSGAVPPLEFRLRIGAILIGTVLSHEGQPLSGVRVMLAPFANVDDPYSPGLATTDIEGKYNAGTVAPGVELAFQHPEYASTRRIVEDPTRLDVTMDRGGILSGRLKSPVPPDTRASIRVEQVDHSRNFGQYRGVPVSSDGGFRVDKLAPGIVRVTLVLVSGDPSTSPTYREAAEPIEAEIASGQETVIALELPQARPTEPEPPQEVTEVEESTAEDAPADAASP